MSTDPDLHTGAAPPDDGGHAGSFSRPEDQLETGEPLHGKKPDLQAIDRRHRTRSAWPTTLLVVLLFLSVAILWQYCDAGGPS